MLKISVDLTPYTMLVSQGWSTRDRAPPPRASMLREWQFPAHWGGWVIGFGDGQAPRVPGERWKNEHEAGLMWSGHSVSPQVSGTSVPRYQSSAVHPPLAAPSRRGRAGTSSSCMAPGSTPPPDVTQWKEAPPRETGRYRNWGSAGGPRHYSCPDKVSLPLCH